MIKEGTVVQLVDNRSGNLVLLYQGLAWYAENLNRCDVGTATEAVFLPRLAGRIVGRA